MASAASTFLKKSAEKAVDLKHRKTINFNIGKYNAVVPKGKEQFAHLEMARQKAKNIKWRALEKLDEYLELFEQKITARGAKVIWAEDTQAAQAAIAQIVKEKNCTTLVKSKSMVTEEIHLNSFLEGIGVESVETDLGEYIQQLDGEPPYHIVTPAMHKSKEDVAQLFHEKLGTPAHLSPQELTLIARQKLREKYTQAQIGVTGANFLLADIGGVAITENEGNARLSCSWPATHIVIAGIEKVLPSVQDLHVFWPLLATYGTGQQVTVYNSIITGARQPNEADGPEDLYIILLDNGRTNALANPTAREALYCIRCGACLNACPVYKNIGGHSYDTTYSGPIGKVITPYLSGNNYQHLSNASSLCGNCTEVCPVRINLHELLLYNRFNAVQKGDTTLTETLAWKAWKKASLQRSWMNKGSATLKNWLVNSVFTAWTQHRNELQFAEKTFNQQWTEQHKNKA